MTVPIKTSTNNKLAGPDHLRALAISLVFLYHYRLFNHPGWIDNAGKFGWTGVDLFFVLSGYLIAGQLFNRIAHGKSISLKTFFLKRFFRIIPAYLAVLTVYFCIPAFREWEALPPLWKFLTFTQNFGLDLQYQRTFSHAWSLCIEEQFYLLMPLIIITLVHFKAGKKAGYLLLALFVLGFIVRMASWDRFVEPAMDADDFGITWYKWIYYPTYNRLDGLLVGISIAGIFQFYPAIKGRLVKYGNMLLLIGLVLITCSYFLCLDTTSFNASLWGFPLIAVSYGLFVMAAVSPGSMLYRFNSRITSAIATLSYSIYLSHKIIIHLTQQQFSKLGIGINSSSMFIICIITSIAGALLLRYAVEKPFLRLRDKILQKMEPLRIGSLSN